MAIVDELVALLGFEVTGEDEARRFESRIDSINKGLNDFAVGAGRVAGAASIFLGTAFSLLGRSVTQTSAEFESFLATLETIEGSSEKARSSMDWIAEFGKTTPYDIQQVTDSFVRLKAYGIDPIADDALRTLGDTASAMGKPLEQAVEAFADAATGEFERLKEFGIKARTEGDNVTFAWTKNGEELTETVKKNSTEVRAFLLETMGDRFAGAMERQSKTWNGMVSNLGDTWVDFKRRIGDAGFFAVISGHLEGLLDWLGRLDSDGTLDRWAKNLSDVLSTIVNFIAMVGERVVTHVMFIAENFEQLQGPLTVVGVAMGALMAYAFPLIAVFTALALAVDDFLTFLEGGESVIGSVIEWLKKIPLTIEGLARSFTSFVNDIDWTAAGRQVGEFIGDALVMAIENYIELVKFMFFELPGKIVEFLINVDWDAVGTAWLTAMRAQMEFLVGLMSGIGSRMGEALLDGLRSVGDAIASWFMGVIPDWARGWFDAESPTDPLMGPAKPPDPNSFMAKNSSMISKTPDQQTEMMNNLQSYLDKVDGVGAVGTTLNDSRADNRQFPQTNNVTVNQTVTSATDAPGEAANATGGAVAGAITQRRSQVESEASF